MNVLIVTNQLIKEENERFYCIENVYDILKRFSFLGTLMICAKKYSGRTSNVIDTDLSELIAPENIKYISSTYLVSSKHDKEVLKEAVQKSDLVIGYVPNVNATTAAYYAKKYKKKYMSYVVACIWDALWNHGILGKIIAPYNYLNMRLCLKRSDYALYVTDSFLQKRYPCSGLTCGCSDVKITDLNERILENRLNLLSSLKNEDYIRIATIASNTVRYKGQHFVILALAKLKKMGITKFHYHLIGSGDRTWLENLAKNKDVSELVHFEGIVPHNRIFEKLDQMHIYIQPSLQEGLPRSVVEAMSRGLLCICANTAAMPEMVDPEYIVERKSVNDIVRVLQNVSIEKLRNQATRNFNEAKKYEDSTLEKKRNIFFEKVKQEMVEKC